MNKGSALEKIGDAGGGVTKVTPVLEGVSEVRCSESRRTSQ